MTGMTTSADELSLSFSVALWVSLTLLLHVFEGDDGPGELPCGNNFSVSYWEMTQLADV
jgi:hypothetical protein